MSQVQLTESAEGYPRDEPLLQVNDLSVTFEKMRGIIRRQKTIIRAVDHVSFSIYESEFVSLVGESGSGKTTIARCIIGLERPTSGFIKYRGNEVQRLHGVGMKNYWRDVQIIYQDPFESLNPRQDVLTTISSPIMNLSGEKSRERIIDRVSTLLEEVELDPNEVIHRLPHQLSGGQRQRVNIARALAPNPKLLIADEPITMLDAAQRMNVLSLLMRLKSRRKLTMLMITHDLASVRVTSSKTLIMYAGKLVETGSTEETLSRPYHPYVELILDSMPRLRNDARSRDPKTVTSTDDISYLSRGCIFRPRCAYATEICKQVEPKLVEMSKGHSAACHNPLNSSSESKIGDKRPTRPQP